MAVRLASEMGGSSPRGRGKRDALAPGVGDPGLIPARAGKTNIAWHDPATPTAHPRAGGENHHGANRRRSRRGSSPRGRGKHLRRRRRTVVRGLIPARAGKTLASSARASWARAHPRAGGENLIGVAADLSAQGSSPRGRGKRTVRACTFRTRRLIPARAGKTAATARAAPSSEAHPRAGGENPLIPLMNPWMSGSSPRGRRKLGDRVLDAGVDRLIPARAGKTQM